MNYTKASDFELNKRLLELSCPLDTTITEVYEHRLAGKLKTFSHVMFKVDGCDDELKVNYCTDWNATMPLAIEHGVYYYPSKNGYEGRVVTKQDREGHYYHQKSKEDNPLRAIVICLIKILESLQ